MHFKDFYMVILKVIIMCSLSFDGFKTSQIKISSDIIYSLAYNSHPLLKLCMLLYVKLLKAKGGKILCLSYFHI